MWGSISQTMSKAPVASMVSQGFAQYSAEALTPYATQNEFYGCIFLAWNIETDGDGCLSHQDCPNVMYYRYRRDLDPINEFEDVHGDEEIGADNQNIPQRDSRPSYKGLVKVAGPEGNVYERIYADY